MAKKFMKRRKKTYRVTQGGYIFSNLILDNYVTSGIEFKTKEGKEIRFYGTFVVEEE